MRARRSTLTIVLVASAMIWVLPGTASAVGVTSEVETGTAATGPTTAGTEVESEFACDAGDVLLGGGARVFSTSADPPPNSLKINGTYPSDGAGDPVTSGTATRWTGLGGAAGQNPGADARTQGFAVCAQSGQVPDTVEINYDNTSGPSSAGTIVAATAICDENWWAIGGGARTTPSNNPSSLKPIGSFPSNTSGTPAADESTNPRAWTAVGLIGSPGQNGSLTEAYAICTNDTDFAVTVQHVEEIDSPETASTANSVTATCPADRALFSGGARAEEDEGAPQQGVHLTGTFPSNNSGTPASDEASVDSWTAVVQTGGMAATGTDSHAFALCETSG